MIIQYCSDLHLEFRENFRYIQNLPLDAIGDILVIAGDVAYLSDRTIPNIRFWKWASANYRQVLMVAGNHEFYNNEDVAKRGANWQIMLKPNIGYYQNKVIRIGDVDFILSTLWSHIPPVDELAVASGMNDYRQILYNGRRILPQNINVEHERNISFIKNSVADSKAEKIVVVTHHLPTFEAIEEKYKGDSLNVAFATELGNFIAGSRISAWIYGHAHHHTDFFIGNTHLVSNPLGYIFAGESFGFEENAVIEI